MIRLKGVDKIYQPGGPEEFTALQGIDLIVEAGQVVVLSGVSGSGKTTLLSLIGTLTRPTRGEITVAGQSVAKLPDRHASKFRCRTVGFIFQHHHLLGELTVADNLLAPLVPGGWSRDQEQENVERALALAGIDHRARQKVRDLSGGEKQRCAIARALVNNPALLLCDEPTAHLDKENTRKFAGIVSALKKAGKTLVIATHDPRLEEMPAVDRVVRLAAGRIVAS